MQKLKENKWNIIIIKEFGEIYIIINKTQRINLSQVDKFISVREIIVFLYNEN